MIHYEAIGNIAMGKIFILGIYMLLCFIFLRHQYKQALALLSIYISFEFQ